MNLKQILIKGVIYWLIMFVTVSILMFIPFLDKRTLIQAGLSWIVAGIFALVLAKNYFKTVKPNFVNGLIFGLGLIIVGSILDAVTTVPLFLQGDYFGFFSDWTLWVGFLVAVAASVFIAVYLNCSQKKDQDSITTNAQPDNIK